MYYLVFITTLSCFGFNCPQPPKVQPEIISIFETKKECLHARNSIFQSPTCLSEENYKQLTKGK